MCAKVFTLISHTLTCWGKWEGKQEQQNTGKKRIVSWTYSIQEGNADNGDILQFAWVFSNATLDDISSISDSSDERSSERILLEAGSFDLNEGIGSIEEPDQLKLAIATYVVYSMSRDGMGAAFSSNKFRSSEAYSKQIDKLYSVAERLNGIEVIGVVGALTYLLESSCLNDPRALG